MHLTLGIAFQSASADARNLEKAQQHLHKAKQIWEAHAPKASLKSSLSLLVTSFSVPALVG